MVKSIKYVTLILSLVILQLKGQDVRMKGNKKVTQNPVIKTQEIVSQKLF